MLKYILPLFFLMSFKINLLSAQVGLGVVSGVVGLLCFHDFYLYELSSVFGLDYLSYLMIYLSVWITMMIVISSKKVFFFNKFSSSFLIVNLLLLMILFFCFFCLDYLFFYISFEASLIPTLMLILGWGYQPERIQAGIYMFLYTLSFSLPLLASLLYIYNKIGSLTMIVFPYYLLMKSDYVSLLLSVCMILAFLVKMPMYMFHLWLPKAHVEAPVGGSMILAGILLKLGGYGLMRVLYLAQKLIFLHKWIWVSVGLMGGVLVSILCLRQVDIKSLVAYSSVAHMGMVLAGLMMFSVWGTMGSVVIMLGHGLCSSGLFCICNMLYERLGSRSLFIGKGLLNLMPSMSLWWFLLSSSNMASPPSLNLFGEVSVIINLINWSKITLVGLVFFSFFSACYSIYLYSLSQHGVICSSVYVCCSGKVREYLVLFQHWVPLNILMLNFNLVSGVL